MSRYIKADDLKKEMDELEGWFKDLKWKVENLDADVVEVVRCRDCIHHQPFPFSDEHICDVHNWKSKDEDFCSFAERRTQ